MKGPLFKVTISMDYKNKLASFVSWNALNFGFLVIVSLVSLPIYYNNLSPEDFAALSLIWSMLAIGTTLDLGVGRALTRELGAITNELQNLNYRATASSGLIAAGIYSTLAALIIGGAAYYYFELAGHRFEVKLLDVLLIGFAAFLTLASNNVLAIFDGMHLIKLASIIRIASALCFMGGPAVFIATHESSELSDIVPILTLARAAQLITCLAIVFKQEIFAISSVSSHKIKALFSLGKWLTLSNIVSIAMSNSDRFILGYFHNSTGLSNYVLASDLIQKGVGLLSVISASIFPLISRSSFSTARQQHLKKAIAINGLIGALGIIFGIFLIQIFLEIWLNRNDVREITALFQIMLIGWLASGFGQLYLADIHGAGDMRTPAIIHSVEAIIVVPIMIYVVYNYGAHGAAFVWVTRTVIDALILKLISNKKYD